MTATLQDKLDRFDSPIAMLRNSPTGRFKSPYPDMYTAWQDEQAAWHTGATLFDQSHHMTDVYFTGSDVDRLLEAVGTNSFRNWGPNKSKHLVVCAPDGRMIGTAVAFHLGEEGVNLVGPAGAADWVQYTAETGGYDVEVQRDERTVDLAPGAVRRTFRFEIEGPAVPEILARASGRAFEPVPFFAMTSFDIAGVRVSALSHTMAGVPGAQSMGFELWGPKPDSERVWNALLEAGSDLGLLRGGMLAYYTGAVESGYTAQPTPAIFTDPALRPYREWLSADSYEAHLSIGGSFASPDVEDYYVTPFDFGYAHLVRFDHDFIGRSALAAEAERPHRTKVWLRWNREDVARVYAGSLFGGEQRFKFLETPLGRYARVHMDTVLLGDRPIGVSTFCGYTVNVGDWMSIAYLDEADAEYGTEVGIVWGEENGGTAKLNVERHVQTTIRATIEPQPLTSGTPQPSKGSTR